MPSAFDNQEPAATIPDFVKIPLFLISLNGEQLFKWTPDEPPKRRIKIALRAFATMVSYNFTSMILFIIFDQLESAFEYTALAIYWSFGLNSLMKGGTLWLGRHKIEFILKGMMDRHPRTAEEREAYRLVPYYKKIAAYNKYLTLWHMGTTTMFNLFPLVSSIIEYFLREDKERGFNYTLPFQMWYIYDEKTPILYSLSYFVQFMGAYYMSTLFLGGDLLLITLVHMVNMHLEYLGRQIQELQPTGNDVDMNMLGPLLTYHNEILDYAEKIDSIFSLSILLNYMGSCLVLCLIGLQVVAGTELLSVVKFIAFLIATMVHVYFISYFGNNLIELSSGISDAFYNQAWYKGNHKYMRMLVLPIARSQKYAHLTAFKFFEISMDSFKSLCTTSYQFFTLLRTRLEEEAE